MYPLLNSRAHTPLANMQCPGSSHCVFFGMTNRMLLSVCLRHILQRNVDLGPSARVSAFQGWILCGWGGFFCFIYSMISDIPPLFYQSTLSSRQVHLSLRPCLFIYWSSPYLSFCNNIHPSACFDICHLGILVTILLLPAIASLLSPQARKSSISLIFHTGNVEFLDASQITGSKYMHRQLLQLSYFLRNLSFFLPFASAFGGAKD